MITLSIDDHVYYINIIIYDDKIIIIAKILIYIYIKIQLFTCNNKINNNNNNLITFMMHVLVEMVCKG